MSAKTHCDDRGLSRAVEKQLRRWEIAQQQQPSECAQGGQVFCFVAMSNQVGAGGDDVAALLGAQLGWPVFDKEILQTMAGNDEVRARLYKSMDERDLGWFEETFRSLMQQEFRRNDYLHRLTETVLCLARQGPAIFLGRGADQVLPADQGLRVKMIAPLSRRIENFARRAGVTPDEAAAGIARIEREREDFFRRYFRAELEDAMRFDLLINTARFNTEEAAHLIRTALKSHMRS